MAALLRHIWRPDDSCAGPTSATDLEAPPGQDWGGTLHTARPSHHATEGFDHVRIPVAWHHYTGRVRNSGSSPRSSPGSMSWSNAGLREGLGVIINIHHFDDFTSNPRNRHRDSMAIWTPDCRALRQIARGAGIRALERAQGRRHDRSHQPDLRRGRSEQIRRTNPKRTIFVGPGSGTASASFPSCGCPTTTKT